MPCCWAGNSGDFNSSELWRAVCIYITVLVFSPLVGFAVYYLFKTRKNHEMHIREPRALLIMIVLLWLYILCQSMHHLILNLESEDWEVWKEFDNDVYHLSKCGFICYLGGMIAFFYRGWMFWFKSGAGREATAYFFAIQLIDPTPIVEEDFLEGPTLRKRATILQTDGEKSTQFFSNRRHQLANPKIVGGVLAFLFLMTITIHIILQNQHEDDRTQRIWIWGLVFLMIGSFEVYLLRNVNDKLGTLIEYKVVTVVAILQYIVLLVIEYTGNSYFTLLIELEVQSITALGIIIWLRYHIGSFSVEETKEPHPDDIRLCQVLSDQEVYEKFAEHTEDNMCHENLAFFTDMYALRKTLEKDPFLELTKAETNMISECARVKMEWIDESIEQDSANVPSAKDIYELYIPPFSEMEVNIPGRMRKKMMIEFENIPNEEPIRFSKVLETDGKDSMRIIFGTDESRTAKQEELVAKLYPAWKTLLSLLNSDTLVRFKQHSPSRLTVSKEKSSSRLAKRGYIPGRPTRVDEDDFGDSIIFSPEIEMGETKPKKDEPTMWLSARMAF